MTKLLQRLMICATLFCSPLFIPPASACALWLQKRNQQSLFVETSQGHQIFTQISLPKGKVKGWYFLVHGLLDSHQSYNSLTQSLNEKGFAVARVDAFGFGETLKNYVTSESRTPKLIKASEQSQDLKDVLEYLGTHFQVKNPTLVGHSMGAGLLLNLLAQQTGNNLAGYKNVYLLAPYVYRLEYYELGKRNPMLRSFLELMPDAAKAGPEAYLDSVISEPAMRKHFKKFVIELQKIRAHSTPPEHLSDAEWLDLQVEYAIAAVKGLRSLNSIELLDQISNDIHLHLIVGTNDRLVELDLQEELAEELLQRDNATFSKFDFGHMLLDEAPDLILKKLLP